MDHLAYFIAAAFVEIVLVLHIATNMANHNGNGDDLPPNPGLTLPPGVYATAVKLPSFWVRSPSSWFAHAEAKFNTSRITDEKTKYDYVLANLDENVIDMILDIVQAPGATPYTTLKKTLKDRFEKSESKRIEELLSGSEMGDKRPSDFFRHMTVIAGTSTAVSEDLIKNLWLRRLPTMIQVVVKSSPSTDKDTLLKLADDVYEVYERDRAKSVFSVESKASESSQLKRLESKISELSEMVQKLGNKGSNNDKQSKGSQNRRSRSRSKSKGRGYCWYHERFAEKAQKCTKPCAYPSKTVNPN